MSGGVVFLRHDPARGLDERGMRDRFAKGAKVNLRPPSTDEDLVALRDLVGSFATLLHESGQAETAAATRALLDDPAANFRAVRPGADIIVDQTISTE
jgi:glutamate synthase (NADPH) large chain